MPAVGANVRKEDVVGNIVHKHEPIPVQNVEPTLGHRRADG